MRIVQLCPYAMDRPGGVQTHVRDLSAWLESQGHAVRIVSPPLPGRRARGDQIGRSLALGLHGTGFEISTALPRAVRARARELRDWGAELVHMHTPWTPRVVGQMARALRLPIVTTIHATLPEADGAGLADRYIRRAARRWLLASDAVVVPSPAPLAMLRRLVPGLEAAVLPPAVDLSGYRAACAERGQGPLSLVFLGRLEPRKGVDLLLRAWPRIAEALPEAVLTVAGDGPMRGAVQAAAGPRLRATGRLDAGAARALMGAADLFLAPAPYGESYGLVLAEAMAAGAVPIAAANPGYAAVLEGRPELLVPPGDAAALADRVIALGRDQGARQEAAAWARMASAASDVRQAGPRYETLYAALAR